MATQGERRALIFLAAVALLGAGTRLWRARHVSVDNAGLDHQIEAVDSARAGAPARGRREKSRIAPADGPSSPVDFDRASAAEIERLPGIGAALARRIVADRDTHGTFGCLDALDAVKGIGPALLERLDSLAAFSGASRPACVREAGVPAPTGRSGTGLPPR